MKNKMPCECSIAKKYIKISLSPQFRRHNMHLFFHLMYFVVSGLALYNGVFQLYCYCLVWIVTQLEVVHTLGKTILKEWKNLFFACLMMMAVVYCFASRSFFNSHLHGAYEFDGNEKSGWWDTFWVCVLYHLDHGMRNSPTMKQKSVDNSFWEFFEGSMIGFLYQFLIIVIMTAVVSGVIIDAFTDMREERNAQEQAMYKKCFICGVNRESLNKEETFDNHINNRHPLKDYLHLLIHLKFSMDISDTSPKKVIKFKFDHVVAFRMLQKYLSELNGCFFPSFTLHTTALTSGYICKISNTDTQKLEREWRTKLCGYPISTRKSNKKQGYRKKTPASNNLDLDSLIEKGKKKKLD